MHWERYSLESSWHRTWSTESALLASLPHSCSSACYRVGATSTRRGKLKLRWAVILCCSSRRGSLRDGVGVEVTCPWVVWLGGSGGNGFICILEVGTAEQVASSSQLESTGSCQHHLLPPAETLERLPGLYFPPTGCVPVSDFCFRKPPACCLANLPKAGCFRESSWREECWRFPAEQINLFSHSVLGIVASRPFPHVGVIIIPAVSLL